MRNVVLGMAVVLAMTGGSCTAASAHSHARSTNGEISFGKFDPALGDMSLWVANPYDTDQRRLVHVISNFSDWSPDGRRIAFDFIDDAGVHIATISADGGAMRQITFGSRDPRGTEVVA